MVVEMMPAGVVKLSPNSGLMINNCVAPEYREMLRDYLKCAKHGQTQHNLSLAFAMHEEFLKSGDMRNTKWENYKR